jgi:hypothetical protein
LSNGTKTCPSIAGSHSQRTRITRSGANSCVNWRGTDNSPRPLPIVRLSSRHRLGHRYLLITGFRLSRTDLNTLSPSITTILLMATPLAVWTVSDMVDESLLIYQSNLGYTSVDHSYARTDVPSPLTIGDFITTHQFGGSYPSA